MGSNLQQATAENLNSHNSRIMKVLFTLLALVACASAIDLFDCTGDMGLTFVEVCCEINTVKELETPAVAAASDDDLCSCGIDDQDWEQMKMTYSCECLGLELASCTTGIMEIMAGKFAVCCHFGL